MANNKKSFYVLFVVFIVISELSSARPLVDGRTFNRGESTKIIPRGKNYGIMSSTHEALEKHGDHISENLIDNHRNNVGLAFAPSLMSMKPRGNVPRSGPSRRININAKN
ncbi:hypothetical protein CASFOL_034246 [Castilleja foliolosa]|uniref:Uncharacterized protein n=1 Tax=Castilleja foliolosa TaxID=1961234 RepID=A0ABD3BX10_9LAMI